MLDPGESNASARLIRPLFRGEHDHWRQGRKDHVVGGMLKAHPAADQVRIRLAIEITLHHQLIIKTPLDVYG